LPGATVIVRDRETGKEFTVTTDEGAAFKVSNREISSYTVTGTAVRVNRKTLRYHSNPTPFFRFYFVEKLSYDKRSLFIQYFL
jgi:hypothetical protein